MSNKVSLKAYRYRIYPTNAQIHQMDKQNELLRNLYNSAIEHRIFMWRKHQISISLYDQISELSEIKIDNPEYRLIHSQILQNCLKRVDNGFQRFFDAITSGKKHGFPRYKKFNSYKSFCYPQSGFSIIEKQDRRKGKKHQHKLKLSKLGEIKISYHRPIEGKIKTCTIKKEKSGKWFVVIVAECQPELMKTNENKVGIDLNLLNYATFSTGEVIENRRFAKKEEKELAKAQRKLAKTEKKSKEREEARRVVVRIYERIDNKKDNFGHQLSKRLIKEFGTIVIEKLAIKRMIEKSDNPGIRKSISDASWGKFALNLLYKAEKAGRELIQVNPAYTSQECSKCFNRKEMRLDERIYRCSTRRCGNVMDRDHNAAVNILRLGLQSVHQE